MGKFIFWAVIIIVGPLWLAQIWGTLGPWEKVWLVVILALVLSFFVPGLRSFIMPLVVPFLLTVIACLFLYNTFIKWQQTGYSMLYAAQQVANGGWDSLKNIAKKFIPGLGAGTVTDIGNAGSETEQAYLQCLRTAIARLPANVQAQAAPCDAKPTWQEKEQCYVNILSAHDDAVPQDTGTSGGAISDWQNCRQQNKGFGPGAAKIIKPIVDIFCVAILPEFMKDWVCIDRWKPDGAAGTPPVRTDQPYVDCIFDIVNDRSSGSIAVDASECMAFYASRQKYTQCVVEKARASPNEWVRRSLPYCEALPVTK